MWNTAVTITFTLAITSFMGTCDATCSEERLRDCEVKSLEYLHSVNETGYDEFCDNQIQLIQKERLPVNGYHIKFYRNLQFSYKDVYEYHPSSLCFFHRDLRTNKNCPRIVPEDCKKHFPTASTLYTVFMERMYEWCNRSSEDRRIWFKVGFCATKNPRQFHKCFKMRTIKNETEDVNQQSIDCEYYDFLYCMSNQVLNHCGEEAEILSKYIEGSVHESYQNVCKGCTGIIKNYWILDLLAFLSFLLNYKIFY